MHQLNLYKGKLTNVNIVLIGMILSSMQRAWYAYEGYVVTVYFGR